MLPFFAFTRVRIVCPHCHHEDTPLAAGVKLHMQIRCVRCHRVHRVMRIEPIVARTRRPTGHKS